MRASLFLFTAVLTVTASLATADETQKSDRRGDHQGGPFDFRSASVAHPGRDVVRHRVTGWKAGGVRPLRLELGDANGGRPGFFVAKFERKAGVYMYTRRGQRRVGPARLRKHTRKSYSFTFSMELLGLPERYGWRWVVVTPDNPGGADKLPNRGFVTHSLATGHD